MGENIEDILNKVKAYLIHISIQNQQPSGAELVENVERMFGWKGKLYLVEASEELLESKELSNMEKSYFRTMLDPEYEHGIVYAMRSKPKDNAVFKSTIDSLLEEAKRYRSTENFREMINFMARFKRYSPYNNMLVKIQNPFCSYYATQTDWETQFGRFIKEDARPMLILAPMHPVMLVYDLDSTEGEALPAKLLGFAKYSGEWNSNWLSNLIKNANNYMIRISFKTHSSTSAGYATLERTNKHGKMRISIHDKLDEPSRFGVLCHELAHIFLGHLGSDDDRWWPHRQNLSRRSVEIEAEAVAYTVTHRLELMGSCHAYLSSYLQEEYIPKEISIDYIAKVASKIEEMAIRKLPAPKRKTKKSAH